MDLVMDILQNNNNKKLGEIKAQGLMMYVTGLEKQPSCKSVNVKGEIQL